MSEQVQKTPLEHFVRTYPTLDLSLRKVDLSDSSKTLKLFIII